LKNRASLLIVLPAAIVAAWPTNALGQTATFVSAQGTVSTQWHVGGIGAPQILLDTSGLDVKNAGNTAFAIMRAGTPVNTNDLVTLGYFNAHSGGATVTGSGLLHATSGTLDTAAYLGTAGQLPFTNAAANGTSWGSFSGDLTLSTSTLGLATVTAIRGVSVPTPAGSGTTVLTDTTGTLSWAVLPAGPSVTGTGIWYSASGTLHSAAVTLNGDVVQGAISGSNVPLTLATSGVSAGTYGSGSLVPIFTIDAKGRVTVATTATVAAPLASATGLLSTTLGGTGLSAPTAHTFLLGEGASAVTPLSLGDAQIVVGQTGADPAAKTVSGDGTLADTGALTVTGIRGTSVPSPPGTGTTVLTDTSGAYSWTSLPSASAVTGTGLWFSTSATLGSAAIALGGDVSQGALSGTTLPITVLSLDGHALPALSGSGYLQWTGSAFALTNPSGTITAPTGSGLWHVTAGSPDAIASKGTAAQLYITNSGATDTGWVSESGDSTITASGVVTNSKVNGTSYPVGGALVTGNSPYVSGLSATTYSALNLAGGSGWVTGVLPAGNQAAQTLGGVLGGTTAAATLNATTVTAGSYGSSSTSDILTIGADGRITAASAATIAAPLASATGLLSSTLGGTGVSAPTAHSVMVAEGASAMTPIALGAGQLLVGQTSANPAAETVSGDATLAATGALTLGASGVTAGGYGSSSQTLTLTLDAKGRVISAAQGAIAIANANLVAGAYPNITGIGTATSGSLTMAGDVGPNTAANVVNKISGASAIAISQPSLQWTAGAASPSLSQATQTSDTTVHDLVFAAPQAPFASAATNKTPGDAIASLATPVSGGTAPALVGKYSGGTYFAIGPVAGFSNYGFLWLDPTYAPKGTRSSSNPTLFATGGSTAISTALTTGALTFYNGGTAHHAMTSAGLQLGSATPAFDGGVGVLSLASATTIPTAAAASGHAVAYANGTALETNGSAIQFNRLVSAPTFGQATATTDVATHAIIYGGQGAFAGATTNKGGGDVALEGGIPASGGAGGAANVTAGDQATSIQVQPGGLIFGFAGPGPTDQLSSALIGTQVSQSDTLLRFVINCQATTASSGACQGLIPSTVYALSSGHGAVVKCHGMAKVTSAGTGTVVGDGFIDEHTTGYVDTSGSVAALGGNLYPGISAIVGSPNIKTATSAITPLFSGTQVGCLASVQANAGNVGTADVAMWIEVRAN
jgi:hypothetical protein